MPSTIHDCRLFDIPHVTDQRGTLHFLQDDGLLPFQVRRIYYISEVPPGTTRGGHACKTSRTVILCLQGEARFQLFDGKESKEFHLKNPSTALYRPQEIFLESFTLSPGGLCLALASTLYDPQDYLHSREAFLEYQRLAARTA